MKTRSLFLWFVGSLWMGCSAPQDQSTLTLSPVSPRGSVVASSGPSSGPTKGKIAASMGTHPYPGPKEDLLIQTEPKGAKIFLDGKFIGEAPQGVTLDHDTYSRGVKVRVEKEGYFPIEFYADRFWLAVTFTLEPLTK